MAVGFLITPEVELLLLLERLRFADTGYVKMLGVMPSCTWLFVIVIFDVFLYSRGRPSFLAWLITPCRTYGCCVLDWANLAEVTNSPVSLYDLPFSRYCIYCDRA